MATSKQLIIARLESPNRVEERVCRELDHF
jgi:hypothetical protein